MKDVVWLGDSRRTIQRFPTAAKQAIGTQLMLVQSGLDPTDWKPMPSIGASVREIRIRAGGAYRVIFTAQYRDSIFVLHVFEKKSQQARIQDIRLAKKRHAELQRINR